MEKFLSVLQVLVKLPVNAFLKIFSADPSSSYGRIISFLAFVVWAILNIYLLRHPFYLEKPGALTLALNFNRYCFLLVVGGYSVTKFGEAISAIINGIWGQKSGITEADK
jgi:hypothetical protein